MIYIYESKHTENMEISRPSGIEIAIIEIDPFPKIAQKIEIGDFLRVFAKSRSPSTPEKIFNTE